MKWAALWAVVGALAGCTTVVENKVVTQQVATQAATAPAPASATSPASAGAILPCTVESEIVTRVGPQLPVRYKNETAGRASILWINTEGKRVPYATVEPGQSVSRPGSATSYWLVANAEQTCIGIVRPGSNMPSIVIRQAAAAPSGAALVALKTVALVIPGDTERQIDWAYDLHEDCSSMGKTVVRITAQPAHGTAAIRYGDVYPAFPSGNPRSACNKKPAAGVQLWYRPESGYAGDDTVSVDYLYPNGREEAKSYLITVN
jgi:hypothetical protein